MKRSTTNIVKMESCSRSLSRRGGLLYQLCLIFQMFIAFSLSFGEEIEGVENANFVPYTTDLGEFIRKELGKEKIFIELQLLARIRDEALSFNELPSELENMGERVAFLEKLLSVQIDFDREDQVFLKIPSSARLRIERKKKEGDIVEQFSDVRDAIEKYHLDADIEISGYHEEGDQVVMVVSGTKKYVDLLLSAVVLHDRIATFADDGD